MLSRRLADTASSRPEPTLLRLFFGLFLCGAPDELRLGLLLLQESGFRRLGLGLLDLGRNATVGYRYDHFVQLHHQLDALRQAEILRLVVTADLQILYVEVDLLGGDRP